MKVMPAHSDDINGLGNGNEIYFKKEENEDAIQPAFRKNTVVNLTKTTVASTELDYLEYTDTKENVFKNAFDNGNNEFDSSNNGLRDVRSTIGYDELQKLGHNSSIQPILDTIPPTQTATNKQEQQQQQSTAKLWNHELLPSNMKIYETLPINDIFDANKTISIEKFDRNSIETNAKMRKENDDFAAININRGDKVREWPSEEDAEYDSNESDEDFEIITDGVKVSRRNKYRTHTSYVKAVVRPPLQQGFIASPGYPHYYIGNSSCSWRITVPSGQRIQLILLDVNLRSKFLLFV